MVSLKIRSIQKENDADLEKTKLERKIEQFFKNEKNFRTMSKHVKRTDNPKARIEHPNCTKSQLKVAKQRKSFAAFKDSLKPPLADQNKKQRMSILESSFPSIKRRSILGENMGDSTLQQISNLAKKGLFLKL